MPMINVTMGPASEEMKKEIIEKVTATMSDITKIPADHFMFAIHELPLTNVGSGGKTIKEMLEAAE